MRYGPQIELANRGRQASGAYVRRGDRQANVRLRGRVAIGDLQVRQRIRHLCRGERRGSPGDGCATRIGAGTRVLGGAGIQPLGHQRARGIGCRRHAGRQGPQAQHRPCHPRLDLIGRECDRTAEVGQRAIRLRQPLIHHAALIEISRLRGSQLAGARQVGECARIFASRRKGAAPATESCRIQRRRGGGGRRGRGSSRGRGGRGGRGCRGRRAQQAEYQPAVVREVHALLTVGDIDAVGQEEVHAEQQVEVRR